MGYVNTPAFRTESLARHGGDNRWPAVPSLIIRHANVEAPSNLPGANLGFVEAIPALLQSLTSIGTTIYGITEQRKEKKQAQRDQASADAAAAKAAADTAALQAAAIKQEAAAPGVSIAGTKISPLLLVGGGVAAIAVLALLLRRK